MSSRFLSDSPGLDDVGASIVETRLVMAVTGTIILLVILTVGLVAGKDYRNTCEQLARVGVSAAATSSAGEDVDDC
jgi:hypothetical protein